MTDQNTRNEPREEDRTREDRRSRGGRESQGARVTRQDRARAKVSVPKDRDTLVVAMFPEHRGGRPLRCVVDWPEGGQRITFGGSEVQHSRLDAIEPTSGYSSDAYVVIQDPDVEVINVHAAGDSTVVSCMDFRTGRQNAIVVHFIGIIF